MTCHKTLLLAEFESGKGWLFEVAQDLQWMQSFNLLGCEVPQSRADWFAAWQFLRTATQWPQKIRRAAQRHLKQEYIAYNVRFFHHHIVQELDSCGLAVHDLNPCVDEPALRFPCHACEAVFASVQQLAVHAFKQHGERALESYYVQSEVCQGCLRTFHTTYRVVQHLRYRPDRCWERLYGVRPPDVPACVTLPPHLEGVHRLPALRKHYGPLRPTVHQRECQRVKRLIASLHEEGTELYAWWDPLTDSEVTQRCIVAFEHQLALWCDSLTPTEEEFHNIFFNLFLNLGIPEFQAARIFIHWIETSFYDSIAFLIDTDVWSTLQQAHLSFLEDTYIWSIRARMKHLEQQWERLQRGEDSVQRPPQYPGNPRAARLHAICSGFGDQAAAEQARRDWRIDVKPLHVLAPVQGPYFVVHLYAGRRRDRDFHEHMQRFLDASTEPWISSIYVLSIDTAIDEERMNVHSERLWRFLITAARQGRILALLLGPPCETWSSARFEKILDEFGQELRGPRPLRGLDECWGLSGLSLQELSQISIGNSLLLRGLWLAVSVALRGGSAILEHPAPPHQPDRPSVWKTGIFGLLLRGGKLFRRHTFKQWQFGAAGVKPTTLLYANAKVPEALDEFAMLNLRKPDQPLIGRTSDGKFCTSAAKEYPSQLCACFASTFWRRIQLHHLGTMNGGADPVAVELAELSRWVDPAKEIKPDYQPSK